MLIGVGEWPRRGLAVGVFLITGLLMSGCKPVEGGPNRIYSVSEEVAAARATIEALSARYYEGGATENIVSGYRISGTRSSRAECISSTSNIRLMSRAMMSNRPCAYLLTTL